MFAQMLVAAKSYRLALELYKKLRDCAHTHKDIVTKAFALKQMAFCFAKLEKYDNAIICYKYGLSIAWTIKSATAELLAYEGLSLMHMYLGNIQKACFYDARVTHGTYEPEESQGYKLTVQTTISEHPWLKERLKKQS